MEYLVLRHMLRSFHKGETVQLYAYSVVEL